MQDNVQLDVESVISKLAPIENHQGKSVKQKSTDNILITNMNLPCSSFEDNVKIPIQKVRKKSLVAADSKTICKTPSWLLKRNKLESEINSENKSNDLNQTIVQSSSIGSTSNNIRLSAKAVRNTKRESGKIKDLSNKLENIFLSDQGKLHDKFQEFSECKKVKISENVHKKNNDDRNLQEYAVTEVLCAYESEKNAILQDCIVQNNNLDKGKRENVIAFKKQLKGGNGNSTYKYRHENTENKKSKNETFIDPLKIEQGTDIEHTAFNANTSFKEYIIDNEHYIENIKNLSESYFEHTENHLEDKTKRPYSAKLGKAKLIIKPVLGCPLTIITDELVEDIFKKTNTNVSSEIQTKLILENAEDDLKNKSIMNMNECQTNISLLRKNINSNYVLNNALGNKSLENKLELNRLQSSSGGPYMRQKSGSEQNRKNQDVKDAEEKSDNEFMDYELKDEINIEECVINNIANFCKFESNTKNAISNTKHKPYMNSKKNLDLDFYLKNFHIKRDIIPKSYLPVVRLKRLRIENYSEESSKLPKIPRNCRKKYEEQIKQNNDSSILKTKQFQCSIYCSDGKTIKNINPDIHVRDENYSTKCALCSYVGRCLANHYVKSHPSSEVLISRLPSYIVENIKGNIGNKSERKANSVYTLTCQFCDIQFSLSPFEWAQHYITHTGEYQFKCTTCNCFATKRSRITTHLKICSNPQIVRIGNLVEKYSREINGYICNLCNYIQLDETSLKMHLTKHHEVSSDMYSKVILIYFRQPGNTKRLKFVDTDIKSIDNTNKTIDMNRKRRVVRNTNPDMHSQNPIYWFKCSLCHFSGQKLAFHYVQAHPKAEVLISRLPGRVINSLRNDTNNTAVKETKLACYLNLFKFNCPFCDSIKWRSRHGWSVHLCYHTGERKYKCVYCKRTGNVKGKLKNYTGCAHDFKYNRYYPKGTENILFAYICSLCNYIQFCEDNVKKHVREQHRMTGDSIKECVIVVKLLKFEGDEETTTEDNIGQTLSNITESYERNESNALLVGEESIKNISKTDSLYTATEANINMTEGNQHHMIISEEDKFGEKNVSKINTSMSTNSTNENDLLAYSEKPISNSNKMLGTPMLQSSKETILGSDEIHIKKENAPQIQIAQNSVHKKISIASKISSNSNDDGGIYTESIDKMQLIQQNEKWSIKIIKNLGFNRAESSKITYYCLVDGCIFSNEYTHHLRNHFNTLHSSIRWNGYCNMCLDYTLSKSNDSLSFLSELQHMMDHIDDLSAVDLNDQESDIIELKHDNSKIITSTSNRNENMVSKPLLKLRRLPGDILSSVKEGESTQQLVLPSANVTPKIVNAVQKNDVAKFKMLKPTWTNLSAQSSNEPLKSFIDPTKLAPINLENTLALVPPVPIAIKKVIPAKMTVPNMTNQQVQIVHKSETNTEGTPKSNCVTKQPQVQGKLSDDTPSSGILKIENINLSSNSEVDATKNTQSAAHQLKPWTVTSSIKNKNVVNKLLRDICLFSLYKCMGNDCTFTTNSKEKMLEHIHCHELISQHVISDMSESYFECSYCHLNTAERNALTSHIETEHIGDVYQCPYCFYRSCSEQNVLTHLTAYHWKEDRIIFVCFRSPKHIEYEAIITAARKTNICTMNCSRCKISFVIIQNYVEHMVRKHSDGDNHIKCGMCIGIKFASEELMINHLLIIHNTAYEECVYCSFATNSLKYMPRHLADAHSSQLPYFCVRKREYENESVHKKETVANSTMLTALVEPVDTKLYHLCPYTKEQLNFMKPSLADIDGYLSDSVQVQSENHLQISELVVQKSLDLQISQVQSITSNEKIIIPIRSASNLISPTTTVSVLPTASSHIIVQSVGDIVTCPDSQLTINEKPNLKIPLDTITSISETQNVPYVFENNEIEILLKEMVAGTGFENKKLYRCGIADCPVFSLNAWEFCLHIMKHSKGLATYKCFYCQAELDTISNLRRHLEEHALHRYFCYFCELTGPSEEYVRDHCINVHFILNLVTEPIIPNRANRDTDFFIVNYREQSYTLEDIKKLWIRKMSKTNRLFSPDDFSKISNDLTLDYKIYCSVCKYGTKSQNDLLSHLLIHKTELNKGTFNKQNEEKEANFSICLATELNIPKYISKQQRFVCGIRNCSHKALSDSKLKDHIIEMHKSDQSYYCPHCNEVICLNQVDVDAIVEHLKLHAVYLWQCSECNNCFFHSKVHIESHIPLTHPYSFISSITYVRTDEIKTVKIKENTYNDGKILKILKLSLSEAEKHMYNLCASKKEDVNTNESLQAYQKSTQNDQFIQTKDNLVYKQQNVEHTQTTSSMKKTPDTVGSYHITKEQLNKLAFHSYTNSDG